MSQRDIVVLFSKELNHAYVTTHIKYMNMSKQDLISAFNKKKGSAGDGGNSNFEKRNGLISVTEIALASDFSVDIRKNAGIAKTPALHIAKKIVQTEYKDKGYELANGTRKV
jgi:hypothetical protein